MTRLCKNCRQFDIHRLRRGGGGLPATLVQTGARLGCEFCLLLVQAITNGELEKTASIHGSECWIHLRPGHNQDNIPEEPVDGRYSKSLLNQIFEYDSMDGDKGPNEHVGMGLTHLEVGIGHLHSTEFQHRGTIALHADPESVAAQRGDISGRHLGDDPTSSAHSNWVRKQLHQCLLNHSVCKKKIGGHESLDDPDNVPLPTRVVDVKVNPPRLINGRGIISSYVTLSYCWGRDADLQTTASSLAQRMQGIPLETMPATIQDAVYIARTLGLQYLWIDRICIVQEERGDEGDFTAESLRMGSYYESSILTIAAAGADGASKGCFVTPSKESLVNVQLPYFLPNGSRSGNIFARLPPEYIAAVELGPLATRGWVVQERLLSRRIVYYAEGRIFFQCEENVLAEDEQVIYKLGRSGRSSEKFQVQKTNLRNRPTEDQWYEVVTTFTHCNMGRETDRLVALEGIAQKFKQYFAFQEGLRESQTGTRTPLYPEMLEPFESYRAVFNRSCSRSIFRLPKIYHYSFGIWLGDLHRGLLWRLDFAAFKARGEERIQLEANTNLRNDEGHTLGRRFARGIRRLDAPSWSWQSLNAPVLFPSFMSPSLASDFLQDGLRLTELRLIPYDNLGTGVSSVTRLPDLEENPRSLAVSGLSRFVFKKLPLEVSLDVPTNDINQHLSKLELEPTTILVLVPSVNSDPQLQEVGSGIFEESPTKESYDEPVLCMLVSAGRESNNVLFLRPKRDVDLEMSSSKAAWDRVGVGEITLHDFWRGAQMTDILLL